MFTDTFKIWNIILVNKETCTIRLGQFIKIRGIRHACVKIFATEISVPAGVSYFAPVTTLTLPPSSQLARTAFCQYVCFPAKYWLCVANFNSCSCQSLPTYKISGNWFQISWHLRTALFQNNFHDDSVKMFLCISEMSTPFLHGTRFLFLFPYLTILALGIVIYLKLSLLYRRKDGASNYYSSQSHSGASVFPYVHACIWS